MKALEGFLGMKMPSESSFSHLLPYAPSLDRWTDDHYSIYSLVELILGNRKEVSPEEAEEIAFAQQVEEAIESGEEGWLDRVEAYFEEGGDLDNLEIDNDFLMRIEREENEG